MDVIKVQTDDFTVAEEYQQLCQTNRNDGAVVFFVGRVRELIPYPVCFWSTIPA